MTGARLSFGILGPLSVQLAAGKDEAGSSEIDPGPFKQRLLLALLLCRSNRVVLTSQIIDALWWDGPPRTAHKNIQVYISHLRKILAADGHADRLQFHPPGYRLVLAPAELDALRFEDLARQGRLTLRRGDADAAAAAMRESLGLWRDVVLADLLVSPTLREEASRLEERQLSAYEDWFEAELLRGNDSEVLEKLDGVVRAHPLRERLRSQQLIALYRAGRQAEALAEYDNLRQQLSAELGLDPSPAIQRLYRDMLSGNLTTRIPQQGPRHRQPVTPPADGELVAHAAAPDFRVTRLPRPVEDFTGRADTLARLLSHFGQEARSPRSGKMAAVIGPPGAGTTTVAVQAAQVLAPGFRNGVLFVPMRDPGGAPRPRREIVDELTDELAGMPDAPPVPASGQDTWLRSRLAGLDLLLVLDGVADEAQVRSLFLPSGQCSVIITSYRDLGGLDSVLRCRVGLFAECEALELLSSIIGAARVDRDPLSAREIVHACGLLPLAVRIAGTRLAVLEDLSLSRFATRLDDQQRLLDELVVGDLSLQEKFRQFTSGLTAAERLALMQVAAAWGLSSSGLDEVERVLERLAGVHVLEITSRELKEAASPPPFVMPRPLWVFAQQLLFTATGDAWT